MKKIPSIKSALIAIAAFLFFANTSIAQAPPQVNWKQEEFMNYGGPLNTTFSKGYLFKTKSGHYFEITDTKAVRVKLNNPGVTVMTDGKKYRLVIEGLEKPVNVNKIEEMIESYFVGDYKGWSGKTTFTLENGQVWEQATFDTFTPSSVIYRPKVYVYKTSDGYKFKVEDQDETVLVRRVKG